MTKFFNHFLSLHIVMIIGFNGPMSMAGEMYKTECRIEYRFDSDVSRSVQEIFSVYPEIEAVEICDVSGSESAYYLLSEIFYSSGVYCFSRKQVVRDGAEGMFAWKEVDASTVEFMSLNKGQERRYEDTRFIPVQGVGKDDFKLILSEWQRIVSEKTYRNRHFRRASLFLWMQREARSLSRALEVNDEVRVYNLTKATGREDEPEYHLILGTSSKTWRVIFVVEKGDVIVEDVAIAFP